MEEDERVMLHVLQMITSKITSLRSVYMPTDLKKHLERAEASTAVLRTKMKFEMDVKARLLHRARRVRDLVPEWRRYFWTSVDGS